MTDFVFTRFRRCCDFLLSIEGVYANHPDDTGGMTVFGISRNNWPDWPGWIDVDRIRFRNIGEDGRINEGAVAVAISNSREIRLAAADFYLETFWLPVRADKFASAKVANALFCFSVNAGIKPAALALQTAINGLGLPISADGKIGPVTYGAANRIEETKLLEAYEREQLEHYLWIVRRRQSQRIFLKGWTHRIELVSRFTP